MPKLTDEMRDELTSLRDLLKLNQQKAQAITLSFAEDDTRGDDFHAGVELPIETAIDEIEGILSEATDA